MAGPGVHLVKSAQRVLEVLEYFDIDRREATVTDVSRALHYPQSSTSVLLRCLSQLGYLYYNRFERTYRPTARVALLGCWAEDGAFGGGKMQIVVNAISQQLGETVVLSSGVDYVAQHVHVVRGSSPDAVDLRVGQVSSLLYSAHGELLLASYPDDLVQRALRRLNAEEAEPEKRVRIPAKLTELQKIRTQGWNIRTDEDSDGIGSVAIFMPRRKGGDRIVLSVVARREVIERDGHEFLQVMIEARDRIYAAGQSDLDDVALESVGQQFTDAVGIDQARPAEDQELQGCARDGANVYRGGAVPKKRAGYWSRHEQRAGHFLDARRGS